MTESWYPNPGVTQVQHERLMGGSGASGVVGFPTDTSVVYAPGTGTREVRIRADRRAIVEGYGWENDGSEIVLSGTAIAANTSGSARTDLIVLRLDRADATSPTGVSVKVKVVQGTPGAGAPSPTQSSGTSGVWELPLAEVVVDNNVTTITSGKVKNRAWYLGSNGQIRCTTSTYPPQEAGLAVWVHPEGRWEVSNGDDWLVAVYDSGVTSVSLLSGFSAVENTLQRVGRVCVLNLKVKRDATAFAAGSTTKVANLPSGFTPTFPVQPAALSWSNGQPAALLVTSGGVYVVMPAGVSVPADRTVEGSATWFAA